EIRYNVIHHNNYGGFGYLLTTCTGVNNTGNSFHHNTVAFNEGPVYAAQVDLRDATGTQLIFKDNLIIGDSSRPLLNAHASNIATNGSDGNLYYRLTGSSTQHLFNWGINGSEQGFDSLAALQAGVPQDPSCPLNGGNSNPIPIEARSS